MPAPGKKAAVLGLGVSGFEGARFLAARGFQVFASDQGTSAAARERAESLWAAGIEAEAGRHTMEKILAADWILISPGIPPSAPVVEAAKKAGKPVLSEIEVASWFCPTENVIAVTGSSGKTTVTTLLGRIFQKAAGRAVTCGNIGNPWIAEIPNLRSGDFVVVEVSSFQLYYCDTFRPRAGLLLNLSPNHQDWHPDMRDYAEAKLRMFRCQRPDDAAVIRASDRECFYPDFVFPGRIFCFDDPALALGTNPNERAVRLTARLFGIGDALVDDVIRNFEGIEHRMEKVTEREGIAFVNDSKSTTTAALAWALEKYPDGRVILIAGGHPKSEDFDTIQDLVGRKVKKAVLIGEARPVLRQAWQGACPFYETSDFREAVQAARSFAAAGDTVLLSPACASFDMFKNYVDRGLQFKALVREITACAKEGERVKS